MVLHRIRPLIVQFVAFRCVSDQAMTHPPIHHGASGYPTSPHLLRGVGAMGSYSNHIIRSRQARLEAVDIVRLMKKMNSHFALTVVYAFQHMRNEFAFGPYRLGADLIGQSERRRTQQCALVRASRETVCSR